jgi:hypothetical protein
LEHRCEICGRPIEPSRPDRKPPTYHKECKRYRNYLDAAHRALLEIVFDGSTTGLERSRLLRQELISIANQMPIRRHDHRDDRGRFRAQEV